LAVKNCQISKEILRKKEKEKEEITQNARDLERF
jgi:hypothetical protein